MKTIKLKAEIVKSSKKNYKLVKQKHLYKFILAEKLDDYDKFAINLKLLFRSLIQFELKLNWPVEDDLQMNW